MAFLQRIIFFPALLLSLTACTSQMPAGSVVSISVTSLPSRAFLGGGEQGVHKVFWEAGDKICVNGVVSQALDQAYAGGTSADFNFLQTTLTPPIYRCQPLFRMEGCGLCTDT